MRMKFFLLFLGLSSVTTAATRNEDEGVLVQTMRDSHTTDNNDILRSPKPLNHHARERQQTTNHQRRRASEQQAETTKTTTTTSSVKFPMPKFSIRLLILDDGDADEYDWNWKTLHQQLQTTTALYLQQAFLQLQSMVRLQPPNESFRHLQLQIQHFDHVFLGESHQQAFLLSDGGNENNHARATSMVLASFHGNITHIVQQQRQQQTDPNTEEKNKQQKEVATSTEITTPSMLSLSERHRIETLLYTTVRFAIQDNQEELLVWYQDTIPDSSTKSTSSPTTIANPYHSMVVQLEVHVPDLQLSADNEQPHSPKTTSGSAADPARMPKNMSAMDSESGQVIRETDEENAVASFLKEQDDYLFTLSILLAVLLISAGFCVIWGVCQMKKVMMLERQQILEEEKLQQEKREQASLLALVKQKPRLVPTSNLEQKPAVKNTATTTTPKQPPAPTQPQDGEQKSDPPVKQSSKQPNSPHDNRNLEDSESLDSRGRALSRRRVTFWHHYHPSAFAAATGRRREMDGGGEDDADDDNVDHRNLPCGVGRRGRHRDVSLERKHQRDGLHTSDCRRTTTRRSRRSRSRSRSTSRSRSLSRLMPSLSRSPPTPSYLLGLDDTTISNSTQNSSFQSTQSSWMTGPVNGTTTALSPLSKSILTTTTTTATPITKWKDLERSVHTQPSDERSEVGGNQKNWTEQDHSSESGPLLFQDDDTSSEWTKTELLELGQSHVTTSSSRTTPTRKKKQLLRSDNGGGNNNNNNPLQRIRAYLPRKSSNLFSLLSTSLDYSVTSCSSFSTATGPMTAAAAAACLLQHHKDDENEDAENDEELFGNPTASLQRTNDEKKDFHVNRLSDDNEDKENCQPPSHNNHHHQRTSQGNIGAEDKGGEKEENAVSAYKRSNVLDEENQNPNGQQPLASSSSFPPSEVLCLPNHVGIC